MRLKDKIAIVTGGASGIGLATVEKFVQEGAKVAIWDVAEHGHDVARKMTDAGHTVHFFPVSVTDREQIAAATQTVLELFGRIDILINNAGITKDRTLLKMSTDDWDKVIGINLTGVFNCTQAIAPIMKEQNYGRIVSTASNVGLRGNYGQSNYVATKAGLIGMTKVWALELGRFGITSNCIAPGFIETAMTDAIPPDVKKQLLAHNPLGFWGQPEDIAFGFVYLASDEARFVNGTCLVIDGGFARD
jgi:3-oxoacyl-[acyl-carrier protein] reductase